MNTINEKSKDIDGDCQISWDVLEKGALKKAVLIFGVIHIVIYLVGKVF